MKFLLVKNTLTETPGLVGDHLRRRGIECREVYAFEDAGLPSTELFDAVAVFGSPESCTKLERHPRLLAVRDLMAAFVRQNKPVLGICFGGQVLAHVLGAKVRRAEAPEIGAYDVRLTDAGERSPYFNGFPNVFPAAQWHNDTFDVPVGATLLATSELCRHQAFSWGRCLAVQFHPEITLQRGREWAGEYASELPAVGKSAERVREELEQTHEQRARLCELLVDGFLATPTK